MVVTIYIKREMVLYKNLWNVNYDKHYTKQCIHKRIHVTLWLCENDTALFPFTNFFSLSSILVKKFSKKIQKHKSAFNMPHITCKYILKS